MTEERQRAEDEEARIRREMIRQQKLLQISENQEEEDRKKIENDLILHDYERELKLADVEVERRMRRVLEEEMNKREELIEADRKQREILERKDQIQLKQTMAREKEQALKRAQERMELIEQERRK